MDFSKVKKSPVLLKEENRKFALDKNREIRGYLKIEADDSRGLVVVMADNVKFFPKGEYVYKLIFSGQKNERRHYHMVGNVSLSAYGKCEGSFRINPVDLDGRGMGIWDFSSAIIAAMSTVNSREALHPVLKGDFSIEKKSLNTAEPSPADYSPFYNRVVLENCRAIASGGESFPFILPFTSDLTGASWKKISDTSLFPIVSPGSLTGLETYGHFIFGRTDSHFFLGVPGRSFSAEQPDGGSSGFVFWQPIRGSADTARGESLSPGEKRLTVYGYWIAAINRYNGHIEEIPLIEG